MLPIYAAYYTTLTLWLYAGFLRYLFSMEDVHILEKWMLIENNI
jgi:hypothetical protein